MYNMLRLCTKNTY